MSTEISATAPARGAGIPAGTQIQLIPGFWSNLPKIGGGLGILGIGASIALSMGDMKQFYFSYLVAFMYFLSIALGALFFVLAHYVTKAGWNIVVRRIAENLMGTLPVFALLFIPIAVGLHDIYHHWADPTVMANDPLLQKKAPYLNIPFFYARAALYFVIWTFMGRYIWIRSVRQDKTGDHDTSRLLRNRSAPFLFLFALSVTYAVFDWVMSLDPHWYSTMYGVYFFAGSSVGIFAMLVLVCMGLQRGGMLQDIINVEHYHDIGKYLFAFTIFWSYIAFCQYMLIWYANMPEETMWFEHRQSGGWENVSITLMACHFGIPMFFLMSRHIKRNRTTLFIGALWMLGIHYVDLYCQIMPVLHHHFHPSIVDLTTFIGVGGIMFAAFGVLLGKSALIPLKDPRLAESLAFKND
jgi:hypothetical protein